jgi:hypothetical protein
VEATLREALLAGFDAADRHVREPRGRRPEAAAATPAEQALLSKLKWLKAAHATAPGLNLDSAPGRIRELLGVALLKLDGVAPGVLGEFEPRRCLHRTALAYFTSYGSSMSFPYRIV